ncbi:MAG: hypothetical protein Unbinned1819contig1001_28 [Prokaryotic dsDNA virus sp.]|nr:MAG: hypothetical protein Unbinned1819contig1001_28 [Prokaryotic dsDNA virus sp.]|tara:strand:+ start:17339 stop:17557 length:219 start_codon:yes stop_codon:yes gene_type:complete
MKKAIKFLQERHPWLSYSDAKILIIDSYERHKSQNRYGAMAKALIGIDIGIFARESESEIKGRLAVIKEWQP